METETINKDCKNSLKKTNQKTTTKKKTKRGGRIHHTELQLYQSQLTIKILYY